MHELKDKEVCKQRSEIGMVFQSFNLFQHMTVLDNIIEAPQLVLGKPKAEVVAHARELLAQVGLSNKEASYPRQLSGGQQQRVAIARALAMRCRPCSTSRNLSPRRSRKPAARTYPGIPFQSALAGAWMQGWDVAVLERCD